MKLRVNHPRALLVSSYFCAFLLLFVQLAAWANTTCQVPNPSTVFCTDNHDIKACGLLKVADCPNNHRQYRLQFPNGSATSSSGTTKQVDADCYYIIPCIIDPNLEVCTIDINHISGPFSASKTVTGDDPCPTEEKK